ncbi:MAG: Dolichol-phosphate mannosyltransferase in lipid-linked oligosaccharide synthesis cluster [uncultured Nocardioidaceae bacterium]|uniref:Dolichol-phosphate mannosyltransferase in lipid-linked oligosaccharide synthesis cluster n=1 Tax=uncultured Nocardioidaceae bacterium TaxID=253824 RepID=A0A6J4NBD3_9ACTN|nr:MAG: Dolichol-phosphate mannosyltransferase in lipid-linked oligosaccharide synthesis cluster [uncultured Nocardioidaceae bacterium]
MLSDSPTTAPQAEQPRFGPREACVVIPMHNEATVIASVVAGLRPHFSTIVCVDDGSTDGSDRVARAAGATVLRHAINLGQGASLQTGISYAVRHTATDLVVTFDADGQHDALDAVRMVERARRGDVDVVLGSRFLDGGGLSVPASRRRLLKGAVGFTRLTTGLPVTDTHNGLRVLTSAAAAELQLHTRGMGHASELLDQVAANRWRVCEVPVTIAYTEYSRAKGQSSLNAVNILFDLMLQRLYPVR